MKTYYKNDLKKAYMILEGNDTSQEDYQMVMLRENEIPGLLKTEIRHIDNQSHYYYDITGKTAFKTLHEKIHLRCEDMKRLVKALLETLQVLQKYMLDGNNLLLDPEYIFSGKDTYYFCYYPYMESESKEAFHRLTEFFVREVDYQDEEGVRLAYTLHKQTMEEHYSIEEIMSSFLPEDPVTYDVQMEETNEPAEIEEERNDFWTTVRRFFEKAKHRYWEEEDEDL